MPVPVFTWTGAYFGINAGYGFDAGSNSDRYNLPAGSVLNGGTGQPGGRVNANSSNDLEGFVGGGQVGYNYQFTPGSGVVVGIEADAQYTDFGNKTRTVNGTFSPVVGGSQRHHRRCPPPRQRDELLRHRPRPHRLRLRPHPRSTAPAASPMATAAPAGDDFRTGYTAGGGIEYALPTDSFFNFFKSSAVTLKVEGLYVNLENEGRAGNRSVFNPATNVLTLSRSVTARESEFAVVRAGLNYKFGSY